MQDQEIQDMPTDSSTSDAFSAERAPQLLAIELRVLGALMEKQLTTPDAYPLTLNSIITACNQKSSRDPISHYHQGELIRALQELEEKNFVRREYGSRADKYSQQFVKQLELGRKQHAVLCIMMLRGPQTLSELRTRTQRMCDFTDEEDLQHCIARLCDRETPYAVRIAQQPGQRGERIGHLFSGTPLLPARSSSEPANLTSAQMASTGPTATTNEHQNEAVALLEMEVASLYKTLTELKTETRLLKQQLQTLYRLTNNEVPDTTE